MDCIPYAFKQRFIETATRQLLDIQQFNIRYTFYFHTAVSIYTPKLLYQKQIIFQKYLILHLNYLRRTQQLFYQADLPQMIMPMFDDA